MKSIADAVTPVADVGGALPDAAHAASITTPSVASPRSCGIPARTSDV